MHVSKGNEKEKPNSIFLWVDNSEGRRKYRWQSLLCRDMSAYPIN